MRRLSDVSMPNDTKGPKLARRPPSVGAFLERLLRLPRLAAFAKVSAIAIPDLKSYSAASSFDALLATSRIANITWSVAVCWIMWPFPATR